MAVNVPLIHISDLAEQTTAADTDLMVIGGTDAKKIKWSTIISLIKTKLNIGSSAISGIGDGTITGAISSLKNSASDHVPVGRILSGGSFSSFLKGKTDRVVFFAFYQATDCPFTFNAGTAIAINSGLHYYENQFRIIGIPVGVENIIEIKSMTIS